MNDRLMRAEIYRRSKVMIDFLPSDAVHLANLGVAYFIKATTPSGRRRRCCC